MHTKHYCFGHSLDNSQSVSKFELVPLSQFPKADATISTFPIRSAHSHTIAILQPRDNNFLQFRLSLSILELNFAFQFSLLVEGIVA